MPPKPPAKPSPKVLKYFEQNNTDKWGIYDYVIYCCQLANLGRRGYDSAIRDWKNAMNHFSSTEGDNALTAKSLLTEDKKSGRDTPRARLKVWYTQHVKKSSPENHKAGIRRQPKATKTPSSALAPPPQIFVNSLVAQYGSTINAAPTSVVGTAGNQEEAQPASSAAPPAAPPPSARSDADGSGAGFNASADHVGGAVSPDFAKVLEQVKITYKEMENHFKLKSGNYLERLWYKHVLELENLELAHLFIVDSKMPSISPLELKELQGYCQLPEFPMQLDEYANKYQFARTAFECTQIAVKPNEDDALWRVKKWIDDVMYHYFELISKYSSWNDLDEGTWDSLVHSIFWDKLVLLLPDVEIARKELKLSAFQQFPGYVNPDSSYDGIVRLLPSLPHRASDALCGHQLEFAFLEVSKAFEGEKWDIDRTKLLSACRASLCRLQQIVAHDVEIVKQLKVVGVLQAGPHTQIFVVTPVGCNLVFLVEGQKRKLPSPRESSDLLIDLISIIWKCHVIIRDCVAAVMRSTGAKPTMRPLTNRRAAAFI